MNSSHFFAQESSFGLKEGPFFFICVATDIEKFASIAENADSDKKQTKADRYYHLD